MTKLRSFPEGFVWGSATAAYQIEGAVAEDGRTPSIWDTFSRTPGKVLGGDTGDVACDHYHRADEDIALMADLGLQAYRFSVSWSRVLPEPGTVNQRGLDFYRRLVDRLLDRGIDPLVTLYHWDLPQWASDRGGWLTRDTPERFAEFATIMGSALGDRVSAVTTLNEPYCSAYLGHATGEHAPGTKDAEAAVTAAHHLNLAHGRAMLALRETVRPGCQLAITLNLMQAEPASDAPEDLAACRDVDAVSNRIFLDPILCGSYPEPLLEATAHLTDWAFVQDGDLATIHQPLDLLGINYYNPVRIASADDHDTARLWPGTQRSRAVALPGPLTSMGWPIDPGGLTRLLLRLHDDFPGLPLVITENGCAYEDKPTATGQVHDDERIDYLHRHLAAVADALDAGVDVRGYYVWSLLDNFEWAWGYSQRFGIVHVDFDTLARTPKDSALWFRDVITRNAIEEGS